MLPACSFGDLLALEIKLRPRFLHIKIQDPDELLLSATCKWCLETEFFAFISQTEQSKWAKHMKSSYTTKIEGKTWDWQFRNLENACKCEPKMNKSQRLLTNEDLLSLGRLYDGRKLRVAFVKGVGFWFNLPSINLCDESFKLLWRRHKRNWEAAEICLSRLEIWTFLCISALWLCPSQRPRSPTRIALWNNATISFSLILACFGDAAGGWWGGEATYFLSQGLFNGTEYLFTTLLSLSVFLIQSLPTSCWAQPGLFTKKYMKRCMWNC